MKNHSLNKSTDKKVSANPKTKSQTMPSLWRTKIKASANIIESLYHAFNGIWLGLRTERNIGIHFTMAALAALLAIILKVDYLGCIALTLAIGLVLTVEFLNTSIEHLVDLASRRTYHVSAKVAKDTAAAAVLVASLCASFIGLLVFVPKLVKLFVYLFKI